jgi:hypothetical protein
LEVSAPTCPDVFTLLNTKPHTGDIYIVGAGPRGLSGIGRIPPDAIAIALNGAIRYDRIFTYWLAFDCAIRNYPWWPTFIVHEDTRNVFGVTLTAEHWGKDEHTHGRIVPHYSFRFRPTMSPQFQVEKRSNRGRTTMLIPGILRGGASIAGAAFQFAAFAGAKRIVLCGVDMFSNTHFDGFVNRGMAANADWPICLKLNWLVESFRQFQKIDTVSLTPTAIKNVKVI